MLFDFHKRSAHHHSGVSRADLSGVSQCEIPFLRAEVTQNRLAIHLRLVFAQPLEFCFDFKSTQLFDLGP